MTSVPDEGSTFTVVLALPTARAPGRGVAPEAAPDLAGTRVLVVDDNTANQAVARAILETVGVVVATAGDGRDGPGPAERRGLRHRADGRPHAGDGRHRGPAAAARRRGRAPGRAGPGPDRRRDVGRGRAPQSAWASTTPTPSPSSRRVCCRPSPPIVAKRRGKAGRISDCLAGGWLATTAFQQRFAVIGRRASFNEVRQQGGSPDAQPAGALTARRRPAASSTCWPSRPAAATGPNTARRCCSATASSTPPWW